MTTDINTMIQEVTNRSLPSSNPGQLTTSDTAITPITNYMEGDPVAAYDNLKKVIEFLESQPVVNEEMLKEARKIKSHYSASKTLSVEQNEWINNIIVSQEGRPNIPTIILNPPTELVYDPNDPIRIKEIQRQRKLEQRARNKEAPKFIPRGERVIVKSKPDPESVAVVLSSLTQPSE